MYRSSRQDIWATPVNTINDRPASQDCNAKRKIDQRQRLSVVSCISELSAKSNGVAEKQSSHPPTPDFLRFSHFLVFLFRLVSRAMSVSVVESTFVNINVIP